MIAFTGVFLAKAIGLWGISPLLASAGAGHGLRLRRLYGALIDALKIPAFIITLAGMFFLRGVSYLVSESRFLLTTDLRHALRARRGKSPAGRLSAMGLLMLGVVVIGIFLAHRTRFGNARFMPLAARHAPRT